jgi:metal-dependent hydrolase (beta-lactamase superfamily II)
MYEAGIDPSSISTVALTHAHADHINGLLTPDGRQAFRNLRKIVIGEDAIDDFLAESRLTHFRPLLVPISGGDRLDDHLLAVVYPAMLRAIWAISSALKRTIFSFAAT